jgi:hypothetical protein
MARTSHVPRPSDLAMTGGVQEPTSYTLLLPTPYSLIPPSHVPPSKKTYPRYHFMGLFYS